MRRLDCEEMRRLNTAWRREEMRRLWIMYGKPARRPDVTETEGKKHVA